MLHAQRGIQQNNNILSIRPPGKQSGGSREIRVRERQNDQQNNQDAGGQKQQVFQPLPGDGFAGNAAEKHQRAERDSNRLLVANQVQPDGNTHGQRAQQKPG